MALGAGRKGLASELVDEFGYLKGEAPTGEYYTKTQTDNKFETKTHAGNTYQKKTLELPLETLMGSKLTVEDSLDALNEVQKTRQPMTLELPLETLMGTKLTVEDSLDALNEIQKTRQPMTLAVPIEMLDGTKLTVENALQGLNTEKFTYADNGVLGAKNWFNVNRIYTRSNYITISDNGKAIKVQNESAGIWQNAEWLINVNPNTDYKIDTDIDVTTGGARVGVLLKNEDTYVSAGTNITSDGHYSATFNSGNNTELRLRLWCTLDSSVIGEVDYSNFLLYLATDTDSTYQPYAMTNRDLTDMLTLKESTVTDIVEGASIDTTTQGNHVRRSGNVVNVAVSLQGVTADAWATLCRIPEGFRPHTDMYFHNGSEYFIVYNSGNIKCSTAKTSAKIDFNFTWLV